MNQVCSTLCLCPVCIYWKWGELFSASSGGSSEPSRGCMCLLSHLRIGGEKTSLQFSWGKNGKRFPPHFLQLFRAQQKLSYAELRKPSRGEESSGGGISYIYWFMVGFGRELPQMWGHICTRAVTFSQIWSYLIVEIQWKLLDTFWYSVSSEVILKLQDSQKFIFVWESFIIYSLLFSSISLKTNSSTLKVFRCWELKS